MSVEIYAHSSARMAEIAKGEAALVLAGPPYFPRELEDTLADIGRVKRRIDELEQEILAFAARLRPVFEECARVLSPRGVLILQTRDVRLATRLVAVEGTHRLHAESLGFHLYARHEWRADYESTERRRDTQLAMKRGQPRPGDAEVFLVFFRDLPPAPGTPTDEDFNLLAAPTLRTARGRVPFPHRHQAPLPVLEALVRCYSQPGDLVVDPFAGGGSTLLICAALGRRGIGYEIDANVLALTRRNLPA